MAHTIAGHNLCVVAIFPCHCVIRTNSEQSGYFRPLVLERVSTRFAHHKHQYRVCTACPFLVDPGLVDVSWPPLATQPR